MRLIVRMWLTWFAGGGGWGAVVEQGFFPYFPPLKPRYILWSGVSYSPKNTVYTYTYTYTYTHIYICDGAN